MPKSNPPHLLVIRLSALGDVAMTIPVLIGLRKTYPQLAITVLTRGFFKPLFAEIPNCKVYEADVKGRHKGFTGLWKLYKELGKFNFTAVADLHNVLRTNILKRFFRLSAVPFVQIDKGRPEKKKLVKGTEFKPLKTTFQRYSDVFAALGYPVSPERMDVLGKPELPESISKLVGGDHRKWLGIAPFAAFEGKMYPLPLVKELLTRLNNTNEYKILLFGGGEDEIKILEQWESDLTNAVNIAGKLDFAQELALISRLDLMISMDSANGHLAAAFGVPVITLWGVTHPYAGFAPFRQPAEYSLLADRALFPKIPTSVYGNKLPSGYEKAMESILPEQVLKKISEVLSS